MKKLPSVFFLLPIFLFASSFSFSPKEWKKSFYHQIKAEAEKNFSDLFHRRVSIKEAGGIVVGQIILKEVTVPGIGQASKVILNFNPLKYAYARGDIYPALTKIAVIDIKSPVISGGADIFPQVSPSQTTGRIVFRKGKIYGQSFSGDLHFSSRDNVIRAETDNLNFYRGIFSAEATLEYPRLNLRGKFSKLSLAALAQNAPGIIGQAAGSIDLAGSLDSLSGKISAALSRALAFGQPVQNLSTNFQIRNGIFYLESFQVSSENARFSSRGKVDRDLTFDLQAEAAGVRLSGKGILGKMQATIKNFKGSMRWKLCPAFLASPLRNIFASGEAVLTAGQIGEQQFDQAQGKVEIGGGRIQIENTSLQKEDSILLIAGQTGIGFPTRLRISGEKIKLEDLKIFNHFLPAEVKNPKGLVSIEVEVTGVLSREMNLLDLSARGNLSVADGTFAGIPISRANFPFVWQDHSLFLPDCRISLPDSTLKFNLTCKEDGTLGGSLEGSTNLAYFQPLVTRYGKTSGRIGLALTIAGQTDNPSLSASFWINRLLLNEIYFDNISGSFNYHQNQLTISEPILFQSNSDLYALSGNLNFLPEQPDKSLLNLSFKIQQANLASAYDLFDKLQGEFAHRLPQTEEHKSFKINLTQLILPQHNSLPLYVKDGEKNYRLRIWNTVRQEAEKRLAAVPKENLGGNLTGELQLQGEIRNPSGQLISRVTQGHFRNFKFDEFNGSASLQEQEIKIERAVLSKGTGSISASGNCGLNGNLSLHLAANNMPLEVLQTVFPDKDFKGVFNSNADFSGPLQNLKISLGASGKSIVLAGVNFDQVSLSTTLKNDTLYLHDFSLLQGNLSSEVHGLLSLSPAGQTNLAAVLKGNAIGLLNLFTNEIKWVKGSSNSLISTRIKGVLENPKINGDLKVSEGILYVRALDSELRNLEGTASIENNRLKIKSLTGIWTGKKTRDVSNPLGLAGTIDISKILAKKRMVDLNLAFSPTRLYLAFPNLYTGTLHLKELSFQGPLYFDFSSGPVLKGKIEAENTVISLSQPPAREEKIFPLNFDLEANLTKNVYAVMGEVATLNLSNIFMNLEITGEEIKISGNLENPSLRGKISVKRGTINIFNREFTLLSSENQKSYFPYDADKIEENTANFTGEEGPAGVLPKINLTSSVNVENLEKDATGNYVKKKINLLARLKGTMGSKREEEGLKISLSSFVEDKTKTPPEMVPAAYSESDLKVMLLPDFIKSLAGIGRPEEKAQVDTNAVMADYLSSRLQTYFFRNIERGVEKALGLESLTLEYNFGPKVRETLGIKEVSALGGEEEKPAWNVGFVKGFFDRLFIDVRYSQGMEQASGTGAKTTFNYQLTYKFNPVWSIIYYREPVSLTELTTGYQKATLKAGFNLW